MAVLPLNLARVSTLMRTDLVSSQVSRTQADLFQVQNQLSTGLRFTRPSEDPGAASAAEQLQKVLEQRKTYATNLDAANGQLSTVDSTLSDLTDLVRQAKSVASANAGTDVTADARQAAAAVVQNLYSQALSLANTQSNGTYIFGGDKAVDAPFVGSESGGVKFVGSSTLLANQVDDGTSLGFMVDGDKVFGAVSTQVKGMANLAPALTAATRLSDLSGATNAGVRPGTIVLGNGTVSKAIDLSKADTVGDVVTAINAAGIGNVTAAVGGNGNLVLSTTGGDNITVTDAAGGTAAADLGILKAAGGGAGVAVAGLTTSPRVTDLTPLSALKGGAGIDLASGLKIGNGTKSTTVTFTSPPLRADATVGDMLNAINGSGADVLARVNADGTGIDIVNPTQGAQLSIGENGGTTAADLGVRSFTADTPLSQLNGGTGVQTAGGDDLKLTRSDGSTFTVDLDGATTVQDVLDKINAADTTNGTVPAKLTASLATTGNGIVLTDSAGGAGQPVAAAANFSTALKQLGLDAPAAGGVIAGKDVNTVAAQGVFANLAALRDALQGNNPAGVTKAGEALEADDSRVVLVRGETGARVQEIESRRGRIDDQNVATQSLLSEVQDTDFPSAIAKYQALQTSLQATMQAGAKALNLSLMDFIG